MSLSSLGTDILGGGKKALVAILITIVSMSSYLFKITNDVESIKSDIVNIKSEKASIEYVDAKYGQIMIQLKVNGKTLDKIDTRLYDIVIDKGGKK